jgi:hypothetical protein
MRPSAIFLRGDFEPFNLDPPPMLYVHASNIGYFGVGWPR